MGTAPYIYTQYPQFVEVLSNDCTFLNKIAVDKLFAFPSVTFYGT